MLSEARMGSERMLGRKQGLSGVFTSAMFSSMLPIRQSLPDRSIADLPTEVRKQLHFAALRSGVAKVRGRFHRDWWLVEKTADPSASLGMTKGRVSLPFASGG